MAVATDIEVLSREELLRDIDALSEPLGYAPGEFVEAARDGYVPDTAETSKLLVLVDLVR